MTKTKWSKFSIKELKELWKNFKYTRNNKKDFDIGQDGYITCLEREKLIDELLKRAS